MSDPRKALTTLRERIQDVQLRIERAAQRAHRNAESITLVAISKTHPAETLRHVLACGLTHLGENKVQEAEGKIIELGRHAATWHLVGHLQANKARRAVSLFDVIHSLDSTSLALRLDRLCKEENRSELPVLIQVDLAGEATKSGIGEGELPELIETLSSCARLRLRGLMALPPYFADPEQVRPFFRRLCELRDKLAQSGSFRDTEGDLSMGMSHDFEVAIEEGATMLRIGTALFGERSALRNSQ